MRIAQRGISGKLLAGINDPGGIINGNFGANVPGAAQYGWETRGDAAVVDGRGLLKEDSAFSSGFWQAFVVPPGAISLKFTIVKASFVSDPLSPPDAFEIALLNPVTMTPLLEDARGLPRTDAQVNLQSNGKIFFGPQVSVPGARNSGETVLINAPLTIEIGLQNVPVGTRAVLYFDLLGFGADNSSVTIDDVIIERSDIPQVSGRFVFYNNSSFDGNNSAANVSDDGAIALDKAALLPRQTLGFANYTNYSRGLNGIIVDLANTAGVPTVNDFGFKAGISSNPQTWANAPAPIVFLARPGAGINGSTRVTITWADQAIVKQWLEVTVKATAATGLSAPDIFYFGNAPGESGNSTADAKVNATDEVAVRNSPNFGSAVPVGVSNPMNYNRDGLVSAEDEVIARNNGTTFVTALKLISFPIVEPIRASTASLVKTVQPETQRALALVGEVSAAFPPPLAGGIRSYLMTSAKTVEREERIKDLAGSSQMPKKESSASLFPSTLTGGNPGPRPTPQFP